VRGFGCIFERERMVCLGFEDGVFVKGMLWFGLVWFGRVWMPDGE